MNRLERQRQAQARRAAAATEDANPLHHLSFELLRAGIPPTADIEALRPGLRSRDYRQVRFEMLSALSPENRHARRRKATRERRRLSSLERHLDALLPRYELALEWLAKSYPALLASYKTQAKTASPHPDSRFATNALDTTEVAALRRSLFEIDLLFRIVRKANRRRP